MVKLNVQERTSYEVYVSIDNIAFILKDEQTGLTRVVVKHTLGNKSGFLCTNDIDTLVKQVKKSS
jgi:hypothetical protein